LQNSRDAGRLDDYLSTSREIFCEPVSMPCPSSAAIGTGNAFRESDPARLRHSHSSVESLTAQVNRMSLPRKTFWLQGGKYEGASFTKTHFYTKVGVANMSYIHVPPPISAT